MSKARYDRTGRYPKLSFWCPACACEHTVNVGVEGAWIWNQNLETPTLHPSIKVTGPKSFDDPTEHICHSFVTDGRIAYCSDSTHALAGKTVDLLPID